MDVASLSLEYWKLGNAITAFSVIQAIATAIPIGTNVEIRHALGRTPKHLIIAIVLIATLLYCAALSGCFFAERALSSETSHSNESAVICWATYLARLATVLIVNVAISVLLVRVVDENAEPS